MPFNRTSYELRCRNPERLVDDFIFAGAGAAIITLLQGRGVTIVRNGAGDHTITFSDGGAGLLGEPLIYPPSGAAGVQALPIVVGSCHINSGTGTDIKYESGAIVGAAPESIQLLTVAVAAKTDLAVGSFLHLIVIHRGTGGPI